MSIATHPVTAAEAQKIAAIASRLQSDQDGEVVNAGRLLVRALARHGLRVADVVQTALEPRPLVNDAWRHEPVSRHGLHHIVVSECLAGKLNDWERGFVRDLLHKRTLTQRQAEVLTDIVDKVRRQRRAGGAA